MKLKANITEDTITEYLDKLSKTFNEHKVSFAGDIAQEFTGTGGITGHIPPHMSQRFNPHLYMSGADSRYWESTQKGSLTTIEILYTGKRLHKYIANPLVWSEFATEDTKNNPPRERILARDYAYFQETGIDEIANSRDAKHQHAIKKGLSEASEKDLTKVGEYLLMIMEGKWVGVRYDIGSVL